MKKIIPFWLLILFALTLNGQQYCDTILVELIKDYRANKLSNALDELKKTELCDYQNKLITQRQAWQDSIFNAIEQQKKKAINAQLAEQVATNEARIAESVARMEKIKAIAEKEKAVKEKNRADSLKNIAIYERKKAEREEAISKAGLLAQEADIAISQKKYSLAFNLAVTAIQLAKTNEFDIPPISYKALGEAIYKEQSLGYKKNINAPENNPSIIFYQPLTPKKILIVYDNQQLIVQDMKEDTYIQQQADGNYLIDFQVSNDKKWISISQNNGVILLWNIVINKMIKIQAHEQEVLGSCFTNDSQKLLTWSRERAAKLWSLDGTLLHSFDVGLSNKIYQGSFNKDDSQLLLRASNWQTHIWELNNLKKQSVHHDSYAIFAAFVPDSKAVISCSSDKMAKYLLPDKSIIELPHQNSPCLKAYFSKYGDFFATIDLANTIRIWGREGELLASKSSENKLNDILFTDTNEVMFSNSTNKVYKWNFKQNELTIMLEGHLAAVLTVQQSQAGNYFLTHALDKTAKLWDKTGQLLMTTQQITELPPAFSANDMGVITCPNFKQMEITLNPIKVLSKK